MNSEKKGYIATILMSLIMGMQYIFIKDLIKLSKNNVFFILSIRFFIAFLILLFIFFILKKDTHIPLKNKELFKLSFFNPIANFSFQTIGVMLCPVTIVGILIAFIPVANVIVSYFLLKDRATLKECMFILICIIGTIIAGIYPYEHTTSQFKYIGIFLIILSIFSRAYYQGKLKKDNIKTDINLICFYQIFYGFICFTIIFLISSFITKDFDIFIILPNKGFLLGILYLSLLATVAVFYLNNYAVKQISVIGVGLMNNLTVIISTISGVIFLKEHISLIQSFGILLIFIGSLLYYKNKKDAC